MPDKGRLLFDEAVIARRRLRKWAAVAVGALVVFRFAAEIAPISDVRASEAYRRAMAAVLTRRAIETAVARARGVAVPVPASRYLHAAE